MIYDMKPLGDVNYGNTKAALEQMANHIRYLQEQIEYLSMLVEGNSTQNNSEEV